MQVPSGASQRAPAGRALVHRQDCQGQAHATALVKFPWWIRQYPRNGVESARAILGREAVRDAAIQARLAKIACEPPPPASVAAMQQQIRADLARAEQQRLAQWASMDHRSKRRTGRHLPRADRSRPRERRHAKPQTP